MNRLLAKLDSHPRNRNEEAMILKTNPPIKLIVRHINRGRGQRVPIGSEDMKTL